MEASGWVPDSYENGFAGVSCNPLYNFGFDERKVDDKKNLCARSREMKLVL